MNLAPLADLKRVSAQVKLIASDVDGTLTHHEQFTPRLLAALAQLQAVSLPLVLVTGRSAGWVDALRTYLPVAGAIAENGGVYFPVAGPYQLLSPILDLSLHRQKLAATFQDLQRRFPNLQASTDNAFRLTDWTFDVAGLTSLELEAIAAQCEAWGWGFTYSTVQCHIKPAEQNKAWGIQQVVQQQFPGLNLAEVLTIGDSPNDADMFDPDLFPLSVGVANVRHYGDRLPHLPRFVTESAAVDGFVELVNLLVAAR